MHVKTTVRKKINKTTVRYHYPPIRMAILTKLMILRVDKGMGQEELSCRTSRRVNWYNHIKESLDRLSRGKHVSPVTKPLHSQTFNQEK